MKMLFTLAAVCLGVASARADLIWYEGFNYPDGSITNVSGNAWVKNSGSANPSDLFVSTQVLQVSATGGNPSRQDDCYRPFTSPYVPAVQPVYASFTVICTNLPSAAGSYFASFYCTASSGGGYFGRIQARTNGTALPNTWRLGISANGSSTATGVYPVDLALNTPYQVVVLFDPVDLYGGQIWVNPIDANDPSAYSSDSIGGSKTNAINGFEFRQASGMANAFFLVTNLATATTFSEAATNVWSTNAVAPVIAYQPQGVTNFVGASISLSAVAAGQGQGSLTYQWRKNGSNFSNPNGNLNTLNFASSGADDSGDYDLVVTTPYGLSVTSAVAAVSISAAPVPPTINTQPASQTAYKGQTVTFSVEVVGPGSITYQWKRNDVDISGETGSSLTLANLTSDNAASYSVGVSNEFGGVLSSSAVLTVSDVPAVSIAYLRTLVDPATYQSTNVPPTIPYQVTGIVTTFTNLTSGNTSSYYLQDGTAGINIFAAGGSAFRPQLGDVVTFTGVVESYTSGLELYADTANRPYTSYGILSNNIAALPAPVAIPFDVTNDLDNCNYHLAGSRVKLTDVFFGTNAQTVLSTTANQTITVTNASGRSFKLFFACLDLDTAGQTLPDHAISVTGVLYGNNPSFSLAVTRFADIDTNSVVVVNPIPLSVQNSDGNMVLNWTDPAFTLQSSTNVAGPYTTVQAATSPYTVAPTNAACFFRLMQ